MRQSNIAVALLQGYAMAMQVANDEHCDNEAFWIGKSMVTYS